MKKFLFISSFISVILLIGCTAPNMISSFDDCITAGYPVMESYPRQCRTPDGQHFVEKIDSSLVPDLPKETCENLCGDGQCQEIVCMAIGCPCAETAETCPEDCH